MKEKIRSQCGFQKRPRRDSRRMGLDRLFSKHLILASDDNTEPLRVPEMRFFNNKKLPINKGNHGGYLQPLDETPTKFPRESQIVRLATQKWMILTLLFGVKKILPEITPRNKWPCKIGTLGF